MRRLLNTAKASKLHSLRRRLGNYAVPAFYWWAVHALRLIVWVVGRWKVTGRENVPREGPLLVVSNHLNNTDPPMLASAIMRRRVRFMAKIELFKLPFGAITRLYGAFPVKRFDADLGAMLAAERILRNGGAIGMFPEGTRSRTGYMGDLHPGSALIALRSGASVLPCAITGTEAIRSPLVILKKPRISIAIGKPIAVEKVRRPTEEQVSALTQQMVEAIEAMLPAHYRRPYTESAETHEGHGGAEHGGDNPGE